VFENRVLKRILGPKREEIAEGWRKLHNEELHKLYASSNVIRVIKSWRMRCVGHIGTHAVGKPQWKRTRGRPRR